MSILDINSSAYAQLYNKHACWYMDYSGRCKKYGSKCFMFLVTGEGDERQNIANECDEYVYHLDAVRISSICPKLRKLVNEARSSGSMVFVEHDDPRFTKDDLNVITDEIIHHHPSLGKYVTVALTEDEGDCMITVFEGIGEIIVDN